MNRFNQPLDAEYTAASITEGAKLVLLILAVMLFVWSVTR